MAEILESSEPGTVLSSVGQGDLIGYYTISSSSVGTAFCPGSGALRERSGFYYCEDGFEVEGGSVYEIGRSCSGDKVLVERFTGRESTGSTWTRQCTGDLGCETAYILEAWSERGSTGTLITCQDSIGIETSVGVMYLTEPTRLPSTFTETLNPNAASQTSTSTIPSSTGSDPKQTGGGGDNNGSDSKGGGTNTGLIAGVVVGVVVGIGIIIVGVFILVRRRKKRSPDDPEKSHKGFMGVLRRIPRPTLTWSRPPDENKGPDSEVIQKAELSTGPETQAKAKTTTDPETAELETRERPGELGGREVQQGPFEMDATPVPKEAAAAQEAEKKVEEAKTDGTQEDAKKEAKTT
ncbi:hypothetical protein NW754_015941 [Fusarium falciforme]|uniref:Uncharacterized protein n=1 Tax=Fusarium falciforme TaxID=195108 RepID=A0A9W8V5W2_9HYPO|nr:hypothetical protein NW754_015941 [Fusarium falciforme]KAJ4194164.1 hypothetical protein NW755_002925 [Fusarium falciforme]KAJ4248863.1 hypothetical protein NW757_007976 [Fusarium falciforme]